MDTPHVAAIILSYNSERDLPRCAEQLAKQQGVKLSLILVDNSSAPESLAAVRTWLANWRPDAIRGSAEEVRAWVEQHPVRAREGGAVYLAENHENRGYSAGNNVGIRLAMAMGADAVLIVNPDVVFPQPGVVAALSEKMFRRKEWFVLAPRVVDQHGRDQNPMEELSFLQEFLQPLSDLRRKMRNSGGKKQARFAPGGMVYPVDKVMGCCFLLNGNFVRQGGLLDERVFLYCEEPILAARVRRAGGEVGYYPGVSVRHLHNAAKLSARSYRHFIRSRAYFLREYRRYDSLRLALLMTSHYMVYLVKQFKEMTRAKGVA